MADDPANAECAGLLDRAGSYFRGRAAYSAARPLYQRALAIREKVQRLCRFHERLPVDLSSSVSSFAREMAILFELQARCSLMLEDL
jgi:hypothetical protein